MKVFWNNSTFGTTPTLLKHSVMDMPVDEGCTYTINYAIIMEEDGM